jgi:hypothetical protein
MSNAMDPVRYVDWIRQLPFVESASLRPCRRRAGDLWDHALQLVVGGRRRELLVEERRSRHLSRALVHDLVVRSGKLGRGEWVLFAPYIAPEMGSQLRSLHVNYVDLGGNCHLVLDQNHVAAIEGRSPVAPPAESRGVGAAGYRLIFTLLAQPEILNRPVREAAEAATVSKSAVSATWRRLERDGILASTATRWVLTRPRALLERWLVGYETLLRPRLLIGRYRSRIEDRAVLDRDIERRLLDPALGPGRIGRVNAAPLRWAWGGLAAAFRLDGHYRGTDTVIHFSAAPTGIAEALDLRPSESGDITLLEAPSMAAFGPETSATVDPLLVYTELVSTREERAAEAASRIHEQYLYHRW